MLWDEHNTQQSRGSHSSSHSGCTWTSEKASSTRFWFPSAGSLWFPIGWAQIWCESEFDGFLQIRLKLKAGMKMPMTDAVQGSAWILCVVCRKCSNNRIHLINGEKLYIPVLIVFSLDGKFLLRKFSLPSKLKRLFYNGRIYKLQLLNARAFMLI